MGKVLATHIVLTEGACAVILVQTVPFVHVVISPLVVYFPADWFVSTNIHGDALVTVPATFDRVLGKVAALGLYVTFCSFVTITTVVFSRWYNRELHTL